MRLELLTPVDYARAVDITNVKVSKELRGRALSQEEINQLFKVCFLDRTPHRFRDAALIALLRGAGLRRAEVVKLDLKDFINPTGEIKIRLGKGRIDRTVFIGPSPCEILNNWIEIRTSAPGPLLTQVNKSGRVILQKLTPQAVLFVLRKRGAEAGLEHFSPHDMRRTYALRYARCRGEFTYSSGTSRTFQSRYNRTVWQTGR